uniref:Uncharacterized protein n=1 Tax=Helicotheca tamesis TaxID=374047 RepID=A0A7S2DZ13_9STRA|mmetsp:Transcript_10546/g.14794  ORF Transcript_10546/g.14794 Transcript_10546/m.14794 type:complete len:284 (+) Transcript_10546:107-958(+)|eukprot:CAMPEP_0185739518 /NCGR_PEP_ID=MMETSP1171-20130828/35586_1 /TAXON_ID=374046 /ORGANISM="Helicotheca tamensis, Strain CCMP826" /LENGTH=283 /DNA_ID=CAMNT_0028411105 /DNA_START=103 /DNA_END=954 /DNA_ORIENTATION=+
MVSAPTREEEEDNISVTTRSSRISFEFHHSVIFEELSKQADCSPDEESDGEENVSGPHNSREQERLSHKSVYDSILDKEIHAEGHDSDNGAKGFFRRVASDLSLCSALEDEIDPAQIGRIPRCSGSVVSMFEQRVINKEIKAGKIVRALSMEVSEGAENPDRTPRSFFSFKSALRSSQGSCLSIDENSEVACSKNETFQENTPQALNTSRRRSAASLMGREMLENSPTASASERRRSADLITGRGTESIEIPPLASIIKDLSAFNVAFASERALPKKNEGSEN